MKVDDISLKQTHKILIVEDEPVIRQSFVDFFEDRLWHPIEAESAEQALEILEEVTPDCAIVDIRLGGMDGHAFIQQAYFKFPGIAYVICTGSPEYDIPREIIDLPWVADRIFRKPVGNLGEIEEQLTQLMAQVHQ